MSRNGSGIYSLATGNPVTTGTTISSTWANSTLTDIASALTTSIASDGQTVISANIPMNSKKLTGLAAPTVAGDALSFGAVATISTLTTTADASINTLTVGLGSGGISNNTAFGTSALAANTIGYNNTAVGNQALSSNATTVQNTAVGQGALKVNTANNNTAVGAQAGISNTTGAIDAFGFSALNLNTTGAANVAVGNAALATNTVSSNNTAVGGSALTLSTANNNTAVGSLALAKNTTGTPNTAVGYQAGYNTTTGGNNAYFGFQTGYTNTTGANNTYVGSGAGYSTTGSANCFVGTNAGNQVTTGANNNIIGSSAGAVLTTGGNNVYLGFTTASSSAVNYEMVISAGTATGKGTSTGYINPGSGGVYQGNNSAAWSITSDQRLKKNIVDNTVGLSAINAIQVRNFEYRTAEEVTELEAHSAIDIKGVQLGAIAQELQLILPECVKTESTGVMSVDATNLTWYLINAVKELSAELDALKLKVGA